MNPALDRTPNLPKYELLERIGIGGMATVYRARDRRLGREVAVKLIHAHLRENTEVAARFVSEAKAVARLRHPGVVEVYDVSDEDEPERYLVVELVKGTTLRAVLTRHKLLPPELMVAFGLEVAAALAHAHSQGIIHRDVKPENVLVDLTGPASGPAGEREPADGQKRTRVKLTDFGIAKLLDAQGVTSTGQVLGSPAHMAPEQIEGGDVGPRADVFALGVMLYEGMVGRLPFDGKNPAQVLRRVLEGVYPPADREQPVVGARLAEVLAGALVKEPAGRYESVDVFALALKGELARVGVTDPPREIERFLGDQESYVAAFEARIVEGLVAAGEQARSSGEFQLAAQVWNRALAYRPGDAELVRRAAGLARRFRMLVLGKRAAVVSVLALVAAGAVLWARSHDAGDQLLASAARLRKPERDRRTVSPSASVGKGERTAPSADPRAPKPAKRSPPNLRQVIRPQPGEVVSRAVVVDVTGPKGGYLRIDGQKKDAWFGVEHRLTLGSHTFEFVFNDPECCRSTPATRPIEEGEGPQEILLTTSFREARLRVDKSPPGTLRCRSLVGGDLVVPGMLSVPMSVPQVTAPCTLMPTGALAGPLTKEVTLTAGQTTEIAFP